MEFTGKYKIVTGITTEPMVKFYKKLNLNQYSVFLVNSPGLLNDHSERIILYLDFKISNVF